ncbi:hypothetical protein [Dictyobacter kobayashii]|uniref:Uncharacterized protein n=1 Tax=Dictyobacter kobayashii TaxID=2014872 RepID=A0A402AAW3_9CHLR|nr:hypothetical protein [Dictyobacter kobayashii]GCE16260.1 hypothetical protein KDK_00600 [Dictyobacter kobayashii]
MFSATALWFSIGIVVGMLASAARLQPEEWSKWSWPGMLIIGGIMGWLGGWLGVWLFGSLFAPLTALWVAIVSSLLIPRCIVALWRDRPTKVRGA